MTATYTTLRTKDLDNLTIVTVQATEGSTEKQYDVHITPDGEVRIRLTYVTLYGNVQGNSAACWIDENSAVGQSIITHINENY